MITKSSTSLLRPSEALVHLMSKALGPEGDHAALNSLADTFLEMGYCRLAVKCLLWSLNLHPQQEEVLRQVLSLYSDYGLPPSGAQLDKPDQCEVSVIMPTYNRPRLIRDSIQSALDQTFQDFELIVVNDGGTDAVEETLAEFSSSKIKYIKLSHNRGLGAARNIGIESSSGRYITYLDDDDIYYPYHLETLVAVAREQDLDIVYSDVLQVRGHIENDIFSRDCVLRTFSWDFDRDQLVNGNRLPVLCVMHKRSLLEHTGLFDKESPGLEDWDLWLRLATKVSFYHVKVVTTEYRVNNESMTVVKDIRHKFINQLIASYHHNFQGLLCLAQSCYALGKNQDAFQYVEQIHELYSQGYFLSPSMHSEHAALLRSLRINPWSSPVSVDYIRRKPDDAWRFYRKLKDPIFLAKVLPTFVKCHPIMILNKPFKFVHKRMSRILSETSGSTE